MGSEAELSLRVLGPVEVAVGGRPLRIGSVHQRLLLALLLVAPGEAVSADRLVDDLWGARPPPAARRSLHSHVSRLRRALADASDDGTGVIRTDLDGYRIDPGSHDLDARRFESLLDAARGCDDAARTAVHLDAALALWRGAAFGEFAGHASIRAEAVRLDALRAAARGDRVEARLAIGRHRELVGELEATVAEDPLGERPHGQLMIALYRSGRQADALTVHQRFVERLREEIGVDPSLELQQLHRSMLRQDPALEAPLPSRPPGGGDGGARARPDSGSRTGDQRRVGLIGRDEEVARIARLVQPGRCVTLTGPGGVGKSRVAEAVVAATRNGFGGGVTTCELAAVRDPKSVPAALLDALAVQQRGDRAGLDLVVAAVGTRGLLLVLDNCEHLLTTVSPVVSRLLDECPNLAILATSRELLRVQREHVQDIAPLALPAGDADIRGVSDAAAGALFCLRAAQVEPSFALTEENAPTIAQVCRRLDGIPLALELAAARVRALDLEALAQRLDHRFGVLTGGSPGGPERHRTLLTTVEWSHDLLTDVEARLFARLSVFAGSFELAAAEEVCGDETLDAGDVAGLLAELVDKSMVVVDRAHGRVRYRLLDTIRAYAALRPDGTSAQDRLRNEHAIHHLEQAEALGEAVTGTDERSALRQLDAIAGDLRLAHDHFVGSPAPDEALRLPAALHEDLIFRPREEVFGWADRSVALDGAGTSAAYPAAMATAARGAMNRGELALASELAEAALASGSTERVELWARYVLTTTALYEGRLDDALAMAEQRVELAAELGDDYHRALAGVSRALAQHYGGDNVAAARSADEARRAAEVSANRTVLAWSLYGQGEVRLETDPEAAIGFLEHAIEAARKVDRRFIEGVALVSLASAAGRHGRAERALSLFRRAVAHWRPLGVYTQQLTTLRNLVELLVRVHADEAAAFLHGAVTAGAAPSFGAEAERLAVAWRQLESRLGAEAARGEAARGANAGWTRTVDVVLGELDQLLAHHPTTDGPDAAG